MLPRRSKKIERSLWKKQFNEMALCYNMTKKFKNGNEIIEAAMLLFRGNFFNESVFELCLFSFS